MRFRRYQLYVQTDDHWEWVAGFDATDQAHAFQQAVLVLKPHQCDSPIRLKPCPDPEPSYRPRKRVTRGGRRSGKD
jgi:hypothetical protein